MRRYTLGIRGKAFVVDVQELAADRFEVAVGDRSYEVTLSGDEDLPEATITPAFEPAHGAGAHAPLPTHTGPSGTPRAAIPAAASRAAAAGGGAGSLNAPMPGVILEVHVVAGAAVERGQLVAVLEAMKMKNSIRSPRAGTIAEVCVAAGQAVGHGEAIVRFKER
jgi:biotin carboxyl carrier protein